MLDIKQTLLQLSKNGAFYQLPETHIAYVQGEGADGNLEIVASWGQYAIRLLADETTWCRWITPMLACPAFNEIPEDFRLLLAQYSLIPLNQYLTEVLGAAHLTVVRMGLCQEAASSESGWSIRLNEASRSIDYYLLDGCQSFENKISDGMERDGLHALEFPLDFGWLPVRTPQWRQVQIGDALKVYGSDATIAQFNVRLPGHLVQIKVSHAGEATVLGFIDEPEIAQTSQSLAPLSDPSPGDVPSDFGEHRLAENWGEHVDEVKPPLVDKFRVEAGKIFIKAKALAACQVGEILPIQIQLHDRPLITCQQERMASGKILAFENDWMVAIEDKYQ